MTQNIITKAVYTADGATKSYTIPFEYLSRSHVYISVDGNSVPYSYTHAYGITFDTAPAKNNIVIIERQTPYDEPWITWTDGTVLIADDLNAQLLQVLFVLQENQKALEGALAYDPLLDAYDALNHRITNLADPIDPQDAVTYKIFQQEIIVLREDVAEALKTAYGAVEDAQKYAEAARDAAVAAENAQVGAGTSKTAAEAARDAAVAAKTAAESAKTDAVSAKTVTEAASGTAVAAKNAAAISAAAAAAAQTVAADSANEATAALSGKIAYAFGSFRISDSGHLICDYYGVTSDDMAIRDNGHLTLITQEA